MSSHKHDKIERTAEYHGHPNYFAVWAMLMVLFFVSLGLAELGNRHLAVTLIFGMAIVKAGIVLGNFMHLRWEPKLLTTFVLFAFLCLVILYFGVMPDLIPVPVHLAK